MAPRRDARATKERVNDVAHPRVLSVCSGIGGLDLGLEAALSRRVRVIAYVERDIAACRILACRMAEGRLPVAPVWTDVHTFPAERG